MLLPNVPRITKLLGYCTLSMQNPIYSRTGRCNARQLLLVRIYTDTGLIGLGASAPFGGPIHSTQAVVKNEIAPMLIGEDPTNPTL